MELEDLQSILKDLGEKRKFFFSEASFQHALAIALAEKLKSYDLHLECPLFREGMQVSYVDILLHSCSKGNIGIELKYKTRKTILKDNDIVKGVADRLTNHFANDEGRYDFLKDIWRLEKAIQSETIVKGYVVFLTNDKVYWETDGTFGKDGDKKYKYINFSLRDSRTIPNGSLDWNGNNSTISKERRKSIELANSYHVKWQDYSVYDDPRQPFRYLAIKIT